MGAASVGLPIGSAPGAIVAPMANPDAARPAASTLRLADVLVPLSLVTDLGMGLPDEQAMRSCLLATALARSAGLPPRELAHVYYTTLLEHLGCTATASEEARHLAGDQIAMRHLVSSADETRPGEMLSILAHIGRGRPPLHRARMLLGLLGAPRWGPLVQTAVCEVAARLAVRLSMPEEVQAALGQMFERWDGKGAPQRLAGEAIALPARFAQVASRAISLHAAAGVAAAIEGVRASSGGWLDPEVAGRFVDRGAEWLAEVDAVDPLPAALEAEPLPHLVVPRQQLDGLARAFGDMVDLLSVWTVGHSSNVAMLVEQAAVRSGLSVGESVILRRAALLHDLGRVSVPAGIWEKTALSAGDLERVRLHPYYTERVLARSPFLKVEAAIAGMHHERLDGSGYHRGSAAREQSVSVRLLAVADAYDELTHDRPGRAALDAEAAAARLASEVRVGTFDGEAVQAVLAAAGHARPVEPRMLPAGLTEREVEVLRLLAAGCSNPAIADRLVISRRTAEHHVQNLYAKIGVSTRPGATLFALEHDLIAGRR